MNGHCSHRHYAIELQMHQIPSPQNCQDSYIPHAFYTDAKKDRPKILFIRTNLSTDGHGSIKAADQTEMEQFTK